MENKLVKNQQICKLCEPNTTHNSYYSWAKHRREVHGITPKGRVVKSESKKPSALEALRAVKVNAKQALDQAIKERNAVAATLAEYDALITEYRKVVGE